MKIVDLSRRYFAIWLRMAQMSLMAQLSHKLASAGFLVGKVIRLVFFFAYVVAIFQHTDRLAGYTLVQTALFFLTFNLVDITASVFFRGIYAARHVVEDGDLDTYLTQPTSPLFRIACVCVDFLDVATMLPVLVLMAMTWQRLGPVTPLHLALYLALVANGVAIALAIHIFVGALAVRTQELENTIWVYRDMMFLGKFPADIYAPALQWALVTMVPIALMTSFPAKALLGLLSPAWTLYAFAFAGASLGASLWFWRDSLRHYTSVSS